MQPVENGSGSISAAPLCGQRQSPQLCTFARLFLTTAMPSHGNLANSNCVKVKPPRIAILGSISAIFSTGKTITRPSHWTSLPLFPVRFCCRKQGNNSEQKNGVLVSRYLNYGMAWISFTISVIRWLTICVATFRWRCPRIVNPPAHGNLIAPAWCIVWLRVMPRTDCLAQNNSVHVIITDNLRAKCNYLGLNADIQLS